ncbi:MAG: primosomal protein N' [Thermoflexus sp.]|uniref:replication restart helicase PriA n=1 Tax=Thermoflexus sp. TaxID=1969742 RepID=UPI0025CF4A74|nr:primosomal protein N' [Thermoflexus sp.]MCS6962510.1 primosomal protein N' [Thermoflexus sp.]MCS7350654.1 primosomal protein N' [Thermoflexus sp.]MDW8180105.1 primosomal protein N' [Anaerolineae bacterium]
MALEIAVLAAGAAYAGGVFVYEEPEGLGGYLRPGHLVLVPFGRSGRPEPGVVLRRIAGKGLPRPRKGEQMEEGRARKAVLRCLEADPVLDPPRLEWAAWLSRTYLAPISECLRLMIPSGLIPRREPVYEKGHVATCPHERSDHGLEQAVAVSFAEQVLLAALAEGPLTHSEVQTILRDFPLVERRRAIQRLLQRGWIRRSWRVSERRLPMLRWVRLKALPDPAFRLGRSRVVIERRRRLLERLEAATRPLPADWLQAETGCSAHDLRQLARWGFLELFEQPAWETVDPYPVPEEPPSLTPDQAIAWQSIARAIEAGRFHAFLLHGITGSGKTELYLRAVAEILRRGKGVIVLVPELALTPQTARRFQARFPGQVAVWTGGMPPTQERALWERVRRRQARVIVGTRSALFVPMPDLGLIVIDEAHDASYKQDLQPQIPYLLPAYHAVDAALALARRLEAVVILGTATPGVELRDRVERGMLEELSLPRRLRGYRQRLMEQARQFGASLDRFVEVESEALESGLPSIEVVDMRQELKAGNTGIFSRALEKALAQVLRRGQQAILFLNRRGAAPFVFCRDCGHLIRCARCDLPLAEHHQPTRWVCHHCGAVEEPAARCPRCGSRRLKGMGIGTQAVEEAVRQRWPEARVLRWDLDTAPTRAAHALIWQRFASGEADVLIGTQVLTKGLDLPLVTLVGVILADVGLGLPDFRAAERTFQLLVQVAGRAGRGLFGGRVILQTYRPDHPAIAAAAQYDWDGFYRKERAFRKAHGYPPFNRLVRLLHWHADPDRAREAAERLGEILRDHLERKGAPPTALIGPAPCYFSRLRGLYRWHILLRGPDPVAWLQDFPLPPGWRVDVDPLDVL